MRTPAPPPRGTRRALVVATGSYADPAITQLRAPALDAQDMIEVLADDDIGGFAVTSIMDRSEPEIRRAVGVFLADCVRDELVLIYLSCHGLLSPRGRLYFAATDTVKAQPRATAVEAQWLLEEMDDCAARRQVLILDCCFSGAFAGKGGADLELDRRLGGAGRAGGADGVAVHRVLLRGRAAERAAVAPLGVHVCAGRGLAQRGGRPRRRRLRLGRGRVRLRRRPGRGRRPPAESAALALRRREGDHSRPQPLGRAGRAGCVRRQPSSRSVRRRPRTPAAPTPSRSAPDGTLLASGGDDGVVSVIPI